MACTCRKRRPRWLDRTFAALMSKGSRYYNALADQLKRDLFARLNLPASESSVLEIGVGTGPNMAYYPHQPGLKVIGVDPNTAMAGYAMDSADACGLGRQHLQIVEGVAEQLPLPDCSQDAVIATLVLCSVEQPELVLQEVRRVLKPGGRFLFMEHVAAQEGSWLRTLQRLLNPLQRLVADGCNVNRCTWETIQRAGFSAVELQHCSVGSCPLLALVSPHIVGMAIK